ncbi:MAG: hypothetical protein O7E57_13085 [Gammaproteobacteria bacterium]|nr:hypothetical protein [Gammaproteobacteria bacterium]
MHYQVPRGFSGDAKVPSKCTLAADFNGDGSLDYAALFEYIGAGNRFGSRYLDLIVFYSSNYRETLSTWYLPIWVR